VYQLAPLQVNYLKQQRAEWTAEPAVDFVGAMSLSETCTASPQLSAWKFAYRLPDGFPYDVKHREQRRFFMTDAVGPRHPAGTKGSST
jgi:hypothetical protein